MIDILDRALLYFPKKTALVQGSMRLSYEEFGELVFAMRGKLFARGFRKRSRIVLFNENDYRILVLLFACLYEGIELFLLNTRFPKSSFQEKIFSCDEIDAFSGEKRKNKPSMNMRPLLFLELLEVLARQKSPSIPMKIICSALLVPTQLFLFFQVTAGCWRFPFFMSLESEPFSAPF